MSDETCWTCKYGLSDAYYVDVDVVWVHTCERDGAQSHIDDPREACEHWKPYERGTCDNLSDNRFGGSPIFECSNCGYGYKDIYLLDEGNMPFIPHYCPNCGRKVANWELII